MKLLFREWLNDILQLDRINTMTISNNKTYQTMTVLPNLTFLLNLRGFNRVYRRVKHANKGHLPFWTPGPVPLQTNICSSCWDIYIIIPSLSWFSGRSTSNNQRYFLILLHLSHITWWFCPIVCNNLFLSSFLFHNVYIWCMKIATYLLGKVLQPY